MKFILEEDKLTIEDEKTINSGSINYYQAEVELDNTWNGLAVEARIVKKENGLISDIGKLIAVVNNEIYVDKDINGTYAIGFVGFSVAYELTTDTAIDTTKTYYTRSGEEGSYIYTAVENPTVENINIYYEQVKTYQISTNLQSIYFDIGAGEIEVSNSTEIPTTSEWEQYLAQVTEFINDGTALINQANNLDIDATKSGTTATVTITKKNGTTKSVEILDGTDGQDGQDGLSTIVYYEEPNTLTFEIVDNAEEVSY